MAVIFRQNAHHGNFTRRVGMLLSCEKANGLLILQRTEEKLGAGILCILPSRFPVAKPSRQRMQNAQADFLFTIRVQHMPIFHKIPPSHRAQEAQGKREVNP